MGIDVSDQKILNGLAVAPGIAIGPVHLLCCKETQVNKKRISEDKVDFEISRLNKAIGRARHDIEGHRAKAMASFGEIVARIFDAHLMILEDEPTFDQIRDLITEEYFSAEFALWRTLGQIANSFAAMKDEVFRERAQDVRDVMDRILGHLNGHVDDDKVEAKEPSILVTKELSPSDVLKIDPSDILGVITGAGGATSHTAILTRTLGVPSVVGTKGITDMVKNGDIAVVNGNSGKVVLNPEEEQKEKYFEKQVHYRNFLQSLEDIQKLRAETTDGKHIELTANIELPNEAHRVVEVGGDGVGLFRSEYLYIAGGGMPSEEDQIKNYSQVAEILAPRPIVIRTFDLGGDKAFPGSNIPAENNPFLGWRAIRIGLDHPEMLKTQVRAVLRAGLKGNVRIMFPMISGVAEIKAANQIVEEAKSELEKEGLDYNKNVPVGMMVEVPSVAVMMDRFAPHVDFFSIGTNDLVQFTLAVDRGNEQVAHLHNPYHPAVLRLISHIVAEAHKFNKPVAMCGEFASQPLATLLLIGLGLDELSTSPALIPEVKKLVRSCSRVEAEKLAKKVLDFDTAFQVKSALHSYMRDKFKDMPIWFGDRS